MHSKGSISLVLISAASLAYEICLTRIFAIQQFHNFAFVVISLAVMGFAASGIALSLFRRQPGQHILASSFALSVTLAYLIINYLPFDSYSIAWMVHWASSGFGWRICLSSVCSKFNGVSAGMLNRTGRTAIEQRGRWIGDLDRAWLAYDIGRSPTA
jgi:hypothetical protein